MVYLFVLNFLLITFHNSWRSRYSFKIKAISKKIIRIILFSFVIDIFFYFFHNNSLLTFSFPVSSYLFLHPRLKTTFPISKFYHQQKNDCNILDLPNMISPFYEPFRSTKKYDSQIVSDVSSFMNDSPQIFLLTLNRPIR